MKLLLFYRLLPLGIFCLIAALLSMCATPPPAPRSPVAAGAGTEAPTPPAGGATKPGKSETFEAYWRTDEGKQKITLRSWTGPDGKEYGVAQGDMVMGLRDELEIIPGDSGRGLHGGYTKVWPLGIVPYYLQPNLVKRKLFLDAVAKFHALKHPANGQPIIRFVEMTAANFPQGLPKVYVDVQNTSDPKIGGRADYGRQNKRHNFWLNQATNGVTVGIVMHEMLHALGFAHEQCRKDRDLYVTIDNEKLDPYYKSELAIIPFGRNSGLYDYLSLSHYPTSSFPKHEGDATIIPKTQKELDLLPADKRVKAVKASVLGNSDHLSQGDCQMLLDFYGEECVKRYNTQHW